MDTAGAYSWCRKMKLSGNRNQCPTCGEFFNSVGAFDKHRTGDYGKPVSGGGYRPSSRRCLSAGEMATIGMEKNASGFWISEPMGEARIFQSGVMIGANE